MKYITLEVGHRRYKDYEGGLRVGDISEGLGQMASRTLLGAMNVGSGARLSGLHSWLCSLHLDVRGQLTQSLCAPLSLSV